MHFWSIFIFTHLTTMIAMATSKPLNGNLEGKTNLGKQLQINLRQQQHQRQTPKHKVFPRVSAVVGKPRKPGCKFVRGTICDDKGVCKKVVVTSIKLCESAMYQRKSATNRKRIMGRK